MQKLKAHEMNFMIVKQQVDNEKVISLLKNETKKIEDINSLLKMENTKQKDDIMLRLLNRKNKKTELSQKEQKENLIQNIKRKASFLSIQGRRASRSLDTDVLERIFPGTEENHSPIQDSPSNSEQRKKSIAMMRRASKDLTAIVEKRMSKLNVFEIEQAVNINRLNSVKKHCKLIWIINIIFIYLQRKYLFF